MNTPLRSSARASLLAASIALLAFAPPARSVVILWDGTIGSFTDPVNWAGDIAPVPGDDARINNGGTATLTGSQSLLFLILGTSTGETGHFIMEPGATLTTTSDIRIGNGGASGTGGGSGTITQNGGDIVMNGGNVNVGFGEPSVGTFNLNGGTISINSATIFAVGNRGNGTVLQTGGSVYVRGPINAGATTGTGQLNLGRNGAVNLTATPPNQGTASGHYTLSGGDFTAAQLRYGNNVNGALSGSTNTFDLQGTGVLTVGTISIINPNATNNFNFTGGTLKATTIGIPITNNGGTLNPSSLFFGSSTINAPATANGVETSMVGTTAFTLGNAYNQTPSGILKVDILSPGSNDFVSIGADPAFFVTSTIAGTIQVNSLFEPTLGSTFDILAADDILFSASILGETPGGNLFEPSLVTGADGRDVLRLTVVPEPTSTLLLVGAALALVAARRRTPIECSAAL